MNATLKFPEKVWLEVNEKPFGWAENIEISEVRAKYEVESIGESKPVAVMYGESEYRITITGFAPASGNSFFSSHNFDLCIMKGTKKTVFVGCEWIQQTKTMQSGGFTAEKIELSAFGKLEEDFDGTGR